jgi:hypothetical protein
MISMNDGEIAGSASLSGDRGACLAARADF